MKRNILYSLLGSSCCILAVHSATVAFPEIIPLPNSWGPEGIATGRGTDFYAGARQGSPLAGAIYKGDLRTGEGDVLVPAQPGRFALGMKLDTRTDWLFVAGGPSGAGFIYDAETGADVAMFQFAVPGESFINDVIVTRDAAYFTDSRSDQLYVLPLAPGGAIPNPATFSALTLSGDFEFADGFNANGIAATPNGKSLFIVQSNRGLLFHVDPLTGEATGIDLGGEAVTNGDGLLFQGQTLYVVRNQLGRIAIIELDRSLTAGEYVGDITNPAFQVPTTIAAFGNSLYAVNARFGTPIEGAEYHVVRVSR